MEEFGDFFPENPQNARRAARADGPADGGDAGDAQLDDARAAGSAAAAQRPVARRHGPALADGASSARTCRRMFPQMGWGQAYDIRGQRPDGHGPGDADDAGARRPRPAGEPAAQRHQPRRAGRGRHGPGARPDGRRRRPLAGAPRRTDQDAAGGRADRAEGRPARADAEGAAQDRLQRAARPVRQADQGQGRPAPGGPPRPGPRAHLRDQAVRVRRPVQPRSAQAPSATPCGATARARRCTCHPTTSRSRGPSTSPGRRRC